MLSSWTRVRLDSLYEFRSGLSKPRSAFGSGYPFLTFKDVFYNFFVPTPLGDLVQSTERERDTGSIRRGDVFLTRTSETAEDLGMSCVALCDHAGATFNGFTKRLRPHEDSAVVPEYAGYFFRSPVFRREVTAMSSLSTRASLNNSMLASLHIVLPPEAEQKRIAGVLKPLDDKIDLNRRMNETLEAMARAIFKSWFVDFDPVRAKAEGRQPFGMDAETAALFPDRLVESELGEIPEGWEVSTLGDLCDLSKEKVDPTEVEPTAPYVGLEHIPRRSFSMEGVGSAGQVSSTKASFAAGDVLFGKLRPYFHKVVPAFTSGICSTDILVLRPKDQDLLAASLLAASHDQCVEYATQYSSGTRMPRVNWKDLSAFRLALDLDVAHALSRRCADLLALISSNIMESRTLADLRDFLLPRLLSGEVRVKDAEQAVEAVA